MRFIIATLQELTQQKCPISTCSSAGSLARVFHVVASDEALTIPAELCFLNFIILNFRLLCDLVEAVHFGTDTKRSSVVEIHENSADIMFAR